MQSSNRVCYKHASRLEKAVKTGNGMYLYKDNTTLPRNIASGFVCNLEPKQQLETDAQAAMVTTSSKTGSSRSSNELIQGKLIVTETSTVNSMGHPYLSFYSFRQILNNSHVINNLA